MRRIPWLQRIGFRTRVALVAAAAVGIAIALASSAAYLIVRHELYDQADSQLRRTAATTTLRSLQSQSQLPPRSFGASLTYQLIGPDGAVLASNTNSPVPVKQADLAVASRSRDQAWSTIGRAGSSDHARVLTVPTTSPGLTVQLVRSLSDVDHTLRQLQVLLIVVTACGVAVALALGYFVSRASLRPVKRLTTAAERVAETQQLDQTIEVVGNDELARLASSFNAMLAALEASRHQQAQLVADAGHELRTPLTSLRTNIEVLMRVQDLPEADRQSLLTDVRAQLEELTTLVGDLVELSREDEVETEPQDVQLDEVVDRAVERARRRAPSVTFDAQLEPGVIRGQPALLERAVLNVLDNAAKWSPPGSQVAIGLHRNGSGLDVSVRDHGPGIAAEDLPHVFDRFYRAANARALPGSGLGLAIVRQVVESHGGTVEASSPPDGGTLIQMSLPALNGSQDDQRQLEQSAWAPYPLAK